MQSFTDFFAPSWDPVRRRSSMESRRNSLLSISLLDFPLFSQRMDGAEPDTDPYAPLAIHEGIPMARNPAHLPSSPYMSPSHLSSDYLLSDRSESSVPSLSASSCSSHRPGTFIVAGGNLRVMHRPDVLSHPYQYMEANLGHTSLAPIKVGSLSSPPTIAATPNRSKSNNHVDSSEPDDYDDDDDEANLNRFKPFHEEKWSVRYKELLEFHKENGHAAVPHTYPKNPQLARWVKRQRRQYKLRREGRPSTMTAERLDLLNSVGFIWDSHDVNWREKLDALQEFRRENSHCNVPSNYRDKKLATWVKCQRRQYKLYWDGKPSAMSPERILELEKVGFEWEIRSTVPRNNQPIPLSVSSSSRNKKSIAENNHTEEHSNHHHHNQEDLSLLYQSISDL